jgi:hypothetical protein
VNLARTGEVTAPRCQISLTQRGNGFAGDCHWQAKPLTGKPDVDQPLLGRCRPPGHTEETAMHPTISYQLALSDAEGNGHTEVAALLRAHAEDVAV